MEDLISAICLYRDGEIIPLIDPKDKIAIDCIEVEDFCTWSARTIRENRPVYIKYFHSKRQASVRIGFPERQVVGSDIWHRFSKRIPDSLIESNQFTFSKICEICGLDDGGLG